MKLPKVSLDLSAILKPYVLASYLSSLDKEIHEIYIPESMQFIEVWNSNSRPFTFQTFQDNTLEASYNEVCTYYGFNINKIEKDNFIASILLLQKAYKNGTITLFDSSKYVQEGQYLLGTDKVFYDIYNIQSNTNKWNINNDAGGITLEGLLGFNIEKDVIPFYGDFEFTKYLNNSGLTEEYISTVKVPKDKNIENYLHCPRSQSIDDLFHYISDKRIGEIFAKINDGANARSKFKDISFIGLETITTLATDIAFFQGIPLTTVSAALYKIVKRTFKKG